jgi:uncharacterized protein YjlB
MFSYRFDMLILEIIFKKYNIYIYIIKKNILNYNHYHTHKHPLIKKKI